METNEKSRKAKQPVTDTIDIMKKLLLPAILLCGIVRLTMRLLFVFVGVAVVLLTTSYGAEPPKQTKGSSKNAGRPKSEPVYLVVKSRADQNQIFSYHPYPAISNEIRFSQIYGTGLYRLTVDAQGAVTQIQILRRFYGSYYSQTGFIPEFDKLMLQSLIRWRAKPGPLRVVDTYWTFG